MATALVALGCAAPAAHAAPAGYHYEMVSPPDKNGGEIGVPKFSTTVNRAADGRIAADGSRAFYNSSVAFGDAISAPGASMYVATRGSDLWTSRAINPPLKGSDVLSAVAQSPALTLSDDLTRAIVQTNVDPVTFAETPRSSLYAIASDDAHHYTLLTPDPLDGGDPAYEIALRARTPDLHYIVYETDAALTPDAVGATGDKVYRANTQTGQLTLISVDASGTPLDPGALDDSNPFSATRDSTRALSDDGSVAFVGDFDGLYRYADGHSTLISGEENPNAVVPQQGAKFAGASSDGRYAYFITSQPLVAADTDAGKDLYRYDADAPSGARLELISVDHEPADGSADPDDAYATVGNSDDGQRIYFVTDGQQLVAGAPTTAGYKVYLWDHGHMSFAFVGTDPLDGFRSQAGNAAGLSYDVVSPDGEHMAISTASQLIAGQGSVGVDDVQVYLYDATKSGPTSPSFTCVSCLPAGTLTPSPGLLDNNNSVPQTIFGWRGFMTDDGTVIFATAQRLVPEDHNAVDDLYAYHDGSLQLVSTGRSADPVYTYGASRDGSTIGFLTRDPLSGWDIDSQYDAYVARTGPGLPEPQPAPQPCTGDECQGQPTAPPAAPVAGTLVFAGPGNPALPPAPASVGVSAKAVTGTAASLKVKVPGAGRISASGSAIGRAHRTASRAATYTVKVALTAKARRSLRRHHTLKAKVKVTFAPRSGKAASRTVTVTFKQPKAKKAAK